MFLILSRFTGIIYFFIIFVSIVNMFYNYVDVPVYISVKRLE